MRILVTGAGGFIGRPLATHLADQGHIVTGIDTTHRAVHPGLSMMTGDLADKELRTHALGSGCDALVHLATVPGGAAELDPVGARRINIDATYDLLLEASALNPGLRVAFASSIAVFGNIKEPLVDDQTPPSPKMLYGGHKAMIEQAVAMFSNRGEIDGISLRLPGIVARPKGPSGMKSAFMSDLFHALRAGERYVSPVSEQGTIWVQSLSQCVSNITHALEVDTALLPPTSAITLPAVHTCIADLVAEIALQCGVSPDLVAYQPDPLLDAAFASLPRLLTPCAERAGFSSDGDLQSLVSAVLASMN